MPVTIRLYDDDGGLYGDDDHCDIHPHFGRYNLNLLFNPANGRIRGDKTGSGIIRVIGGSTYGGHGSDDDRCEVHFRIDRLRTTPLPNLPPVSVSIPKPPPLVIPPGVVATVPKSDGFSNLRTLRTGLEKVELSVNYNYVSNHGKQVWIGVEVLKRGRRARYFGYRPSKVRRGSGKAKITVSYRRPKPTSMLRTDQVRVFFYESGKTRFFSKTFPYPHTWVRE